MNKQLRGLSAKAVLAAGAVFLISCDGDSKGIGEGGAKLRDLHMHVVAASSGDASAWVYPKESPVINEPLELEEGKSLWVSAAGSPGDLAAQPVKLSVNLKQQGVDPALFQNVAYQDVSLIYAAKLDQAANDRYYIAYNEDGSAAGASHVTIPQSFQITAPLPNEIVSLANDLVVNWDAPGNIDEVRVAAAVFCDGITDESGWYDAVIGNTGTHTIPGSVISHEFMTDTCPLTVEVATGREGTPGTGFGGGEIVGYRITTVMLTATN